MIDVNKQNHFKIKGNSDLTLFGTTNKPVIIEGAEYVCVNIDDYCLLTNKKAITFKDCDSIVLLGNKKLLLNGTIEIIGDSCYTLIDKITSIGADVGIQMEDGYVDYGTVCITESVIVNAKQEGILLGDPLSSHKQFDYLEISDCIIKNTSKEGVYIRGVGSGSINDTLIQSNCVYDTVISDNVNLDSDNSKLGTISIHANSKLS